MFYKELHPGRDLDEVVRCFWMLEHDYRTAFHNHEHLWADVYFELIFGFGERYYELVEGDKQLLPANFVVAPSRTKLILHSDGFTGFIAVRFQPWGIVSFSKIALETTIGKIIPAEKMFGQEITSLATRLKHQPGDKKVEVLREYFTEQL